MDNMSLWERFKKYLLADERTGLTLDISRMDFTSTLFQEQAAAAKRAFEAMAKLEAGAIANPDEGRMVGHYWLRNSGLAPTPEIRAAIDSSLSQVKKFARAVHAGKIKPQKASRFTKLLIIGIGGSALGPQFVAKALGSPRHDKLAPFFFDNTDPDGMDAVLQQINRQDAKNAKDAKNRRRVEQGGYQNPLLSPRPLRLGGEFSGLRETLCIVISKSGETKETRNGMLEARRAFESARLAFPAHAVAITQDGSQLDKAAVAEGWLARFPMWDWVGGRTSETSVVGLLPAALQGLDIQGLLDGARAMDETTRAKEPLRNPARRISLTSGGSGQVAT